MNKLLLLFLLTISQFSHAETKLSALPLLTGASVGSTDSLPFTNVALSETARLAISELKNVTSLQLVGDSGSGGTIGFCPAPPAGSAALNKFLKANGTYSAIPLITSALMSSGAATSGQVPTADGAGGVSYLSASNLVSVSAKTANYTLALTDDIVTADSSGGAFNLTLPAASTATGKRYVIKKTDNSANALSLLRAGSDTITDFSTGLTSTTLNTQGESLEIFRDTSSSWQIAGRKTTGPLIAYGSPTLVGFGSGGTSPTNISIFSSRDADSLKIIGKFTTGTATATEARVPLQLGSVVLTSDSTKIASIRVVGNWGLSPTSATTYKTILVESGVTYLTFGFNNAATSELSKLNGNGMGNGADVSFYATVPISGWNP